MIVVPLPQSPAAPVQSGHLYQLQRLRGKSIALLTGKESNHETDTTASKQNSVATYCVANGE